MRRSWKLLTAAAVALTLTTAGAMAQQRVFFGIATGGFAELNTGRLGD